MIENLNIEQLIEALTILGRKYSTCSVAIDAQRDTIVLLPHTPLPPQDDIDYKNIELTA